MQLPLLTEARDDVFFRQILPELLVFTAENPRDPRRLQLLKEVLDVTAEYLRKTQRWPKDDLEV